MFHRIAILSAALAVLPMAMTAVTRGAELRILGTGAVQHSVIEAIGSFGKETGHTVQAAFGTAGAIARRVAGNEPADLILSSQAGIRDLAEKGSVVGGAPVALGQVRVAIGVRKGAARPDVSTPEKLKALLLATPSFAYGDPASGATTGIHFAGILAGLGIAEAVRSKAILRNGGLLVMKEVAENRAELGVTQSSEIIAVPGTEIAGYLPGDLQLVSIYSGQVAAKAREPELARLFLDYLAGPKGREIFHHHGFEPVTGK